VGLVFVGVTAVAAQVASTGRATLALASAVLVITFLLRAMGDIGDNPLRWLSPIGWAQSVRAFAGEQWWTLAFSGVVAVGLVTLAFWLSTLRDPGSGLLPTRPGPDRASAALLGPLGLAVRLHRGAVIGWAVGLVTIGIVYGSIGNDIEEMVEENPVYADFLAQAQGTSLTDAFFATSLMLLAVMASGFAISAVLRLRSEEDAGRAEPLLAGPLPRWRWAFDHLAVAVVGSALVVAAGGLGIGGAYAVVSSDSSQVLRMVGASLVTLPAVFVLASIAMALFGLVPRFALAAWGALAVVVLVGVFADLLRLPEWSRQISPFQHLPATPAEPFALGPVVAVTAVAAALTAAGLWGLRRRDLHAS
jgi:ABC-2 type transport system permease protein